MRGSDQFATSEATMRYTTIARLALATIATLAATVIAADPQPRLPRDNLLVYRGPDGRPVPVKTAEDWARRRTEVVRGMESVMGKLPGPEKRCELDPRVEEE